jgi:hypothetical protein
MGEAAMSSDTLNLTQTERSMLNAMYYCCDERQAISVYRAHLAAEKAQLEAQLAEARKDVGGQAVALMQKPGLPRRKS